MNRANAEEGQGQDQLYKTIVALVGDSTVTETAGWGKAFAGRFDDDIEVLNFAVGGRSSKSFLDEGRLSRVIEARPDYVLIQFGHNDQPGKGPTRETDPATTFRDNLMMYVNEFRKIEAQPILVSSVVRRTFDSDDRIQSTLTPWAAATHAIAAEMNVPFVDLHKASMDYHNRIGRNASLLFNPKEGDVSHFNTKMRLQPRFAGSRDDSASRIVRLAEPDSVHRQQTVVVDGQPVAIFDLDSGRSTTMESIRTRHGRGKRFEMWATGDTRSGGRHVTEKTPSMQDARTM